MFPIHQSLHFRRPSQLGVRVQDANRVGAQDARYPAMIHYRMPNWNPARSKAFQAERQFY
jgi:hypothetical protein